ncbi:Nucleoporin NUP133 [Paramyrothecium foliicola]|nr:Nucleoporin NUP133 [Paramyrothecium foliicola]
MFSPSVGDGGPATATRSRRRQRPKSTDSLVQQPKAKRQRIPLTEQTFVNPEAPPEMAEVKNIDKVATLDVKHDSIENLHTPRRDSTIRTKKLKHGDRAAAKGDGSLLLTSTNAYTVNKLPALPDRIRSDWNGNQYADFFSSSGYALSLSPTHAVVWRYTSTSQSPETFTFTLPPASKPSDPLPVGCLVSPSASASEPGLVVVMAGSGKVVYWESISSAATFAFIKKDRSGVEHAISGMSSGEKVLAITNAETAGFILTFNTGRLAYMTVRDSHGRPSISVQFLRSSLTSTHNGLLGSIRHAFSHLSLRGHIAAVRADRSTRLGEKNIVALTAKGKLQAWKVHRGGHNECVGESDAREELISAIQDQDPASRTFPADSFEAIDFTYVPKGLESKYVELSRLSEAMALDNPSTQHLLLLVSFTRRSESRYSLVEAILSSTGCKIGMIRPITSYNSPIAASDSTQSFRPRVYLPRPALVAFVVFDRASVIASVAVPPESPDVQLQADNHIVPASFEDVVDFQGDNIHDIVGSGFEEAPPAYQGHDETRSNRHKIKNPAVLLMVRGTGVVRIVTTDVDKFASEQPPQVSAKSKLEQAVFFGLKSDNPLIFDRKREINFPKDEITQAALEVSHEILSSTTNFINTLPAALEDNLYTRSRALERLMSHLNTIGVELDRNTKWSLLQNAEKMHVANLLWKRHEAFTATRPADDKKSLIGRIVEFIHETQKSNPVAKIGEVDKVRHWFINDVFRLELFVAWAYEVIKNLYVSGLLPQHKVSVMVHEAMQVNIATHIGALEFRKKNLAFYGLAREDMQMNILRDGYQGLPEFWTGCHYIANNLKRLTDLTGEWLKKVEDGSEKSKPADKAESAMMDKIVQELPSLIDAMLTSVLEYARWADTSMDQKEQGKKFLASYQQDRHDKTIALARAGMWEEGAKIAEKHKSLDALSVILLDHIEELEAYLTRPNLSLIETRDHKNLRQTEKLKLEECLEAYGQAFAFPMYEHLLKKHGVDTMLSFDLDKLGFKTKFLRTKPELARISWINDVQLENDVGHAAETLMDLALNKEQQIWNKKIELSLGKLALLAEAEDKQTNSTAFKVNVDEARHEAQLKKVERELISIKIQDQLHSHIFLSTYDAVDEAAALSFAMEAHSANIPRRQKALYQIFEDGMKRLLRHEALDAMTLIDLLTLVYLKPETRDDVPNPFWLALKVAESSCHKDEAKEAKRLIWRRLFIRDDWAKINDTQMKDDTEVVERLADTELFGMLTDCVRFQDPLNPFSPMVATEAIGAFTEDLDHRFRDFDASFQTKMSDAMKWEDKALQQHIDKHRLLEWVPTTLQTAQAEVAAELDEATKAKAAAEDLEKTRSGFGINEPGEKSHASLFGQS